MQQRPCIVPVALQDLFGEVAVRLRARLALGVGIEDYLEELLRVQVDAGLPDIAQLEGCLIQQLIHHVALLQRVAQVLEKARCSENLFGG